MATTIERIMQTDRPPKILHGVKDIHVQGQTFQCTVLEPTVRMDFSLDRIAFIENEYGYETVYMLPLRDWEEARLNPTKYQNALKQIDHIYSHIMPKQRIEILIAEMIRHYDLKLTKVPQLPPPVLSETLHRFA